MPQGSNGAPLGASDWKALLRQHEHRPHPLPQAPFAMTMSWRDLLFAHWPLRAEVMRAAVPAGLELDLWSGEAWLGVVPFHMTQVGKLGLNQLPWVSTFSELNLRTYERPARQHLSRRHPPCALAVAAGRGGARPDRLSALDRAAVARRGACAALRAPARRVGMVARACLSAAEFASRRVLLHRAQWLTGPSAGRRDAPARDSTRAVQR